ncbi:CDP-alcohol phosphatidyltransferase family protein [Methylocapsa polymorpha]|uniref:CDP-alcohol phosphatidyltransferase family protein n=1 Tax=Methylocapsa polymorpha TaxID=3080828 RepID=A0ABZ0HVE5_9HYPH|nr:CDP-alcohol phosphatidyltransferase family protein [Methylocapsa sp. RX1]
MSQSILFDGQTVSTVARQPSIRIQKNILARLERDLLNWLCLHMPRAVTPDRLTGLGVVGAGIVFVGYAASRFDLTFLWLATFGLVVHWFGDSLDGSLARYRRVERPRYGYFLDHSVDAVCNLMIMVGIGLSPFVRLDVALFALLGYFMLCMYVFLHNHVSGNFQLSFLALGPTELRIGLIGINCWMYSEGGAGGAKVLIGGAAFSSYDLVLCGAAIVFVGLFIVNMLKVAQKLRVEDSRLDPRAQMAKAADL